MTTHQIQLNGDARSVAAATVSALLSELNLPVQKIAVERNLCIVPRSEFDKTPIADGDRIEIVQFVGGG